MAMSFGTRPTTSIRSVTSFGCSVVLANKPDLVFGLYYICIVDFHETAPTRVLILGHSFIHRRSFLFAKYSLVKCIHNIMNLPTCPMKGKK